MSSVITALDPALNQLPAAVHHIHIMGVCGTGMAALAGMLQERGFQVTGSDSNVYPPMSDLLATLGIKVMEGYRAENLAVRPDLVIVGNVIRATNPEALRVRELAIPYLSMPQALGHFFLAGHRSLVVAGTHGKTTTSSLLATTLHHAGCAPSFMIGGIVEAFGRNYHLGKGPFFVVEGDEYDTAFFDKGSKFLHYQPHCAIITSIEFDHADIFTDLEVIKKSFARFVSLLPPEGALIACGDDPVVAQIAARARCPVISYGLGSQNLFRLEELRIEGVRTTFTVTRAGREVGEFTLAMPGRHNALNATAVIALLQHLGLEREAIRAGLESFAGVRRRQQIRGVVGGVTVIDDFAHHPTAVRETVTALRHAWPGSRLVIVFEPRTNSSRRAVFQEQYVSAFEGADLVVVREHIPLDNVPAAQQFSSRKLIADLRHRGCDAHYFPDTGAILDFLGKTAQAGDVVAILSNGGFDNIHARLLALLAPAPPALG